MLAALLAMLFVSIHCPAGIALGVLFSLLLAVLFFLIGVAFAVVMVVQVGEGGRGGEFTSQD